ncbi:MAG: T9SS type A sorting domain-containing protein [Bacteroidia bacterium]
MRKFAAILFLLFITYSTSQAQCVPGTSTDPGITPDSATGLAPAVMGQPYSQVMQIVVPTDTTAMIGPFPVNVTIVSISLTSFTNLPPGLTYSCTPSNCVFPGGSNGCVLISGTPTVSGTFNPVAITASVGSTPLGNITQYDTISYYTIVVSGSATGIDESTGLSFSMDQNTPNPCNEYADIHFTVPHMGEVEFRMFNLIGKEVYRSLINAEQGENNVKIDSRDFAPGVYMYTMTWNGESISKRMVISRK